MISLRPLLGAWLNTDDWKRMWNPLCGEIWNKDIYQDMSVNTFPLLPLRYQINALGPLMWDREEGTRLFMTITDGSSAKGRIHFIFSASLFFAFFFFFPLWEDGSLGHL